MKPKVYVETSVVSYLTAKPSRDIVTAARQELTREWWANHRSGYELFVSEFVRKEAGSGHPKMAQLRLEAITGKHLANAVLRKKVEKFCIARGYDPCIICTPEELLEG